MLNDLDDTLRELLVKKGGLDPSEVDISFDIPTRDWSTPVTRPTVNLYLYDIRENRELRDVHWEEYALGDDEVGHRLPPRRIDVSYMITCWTSDVQDQHRLLWRVLETFMRHSPLPDEVLSGNLKGLKHPASTLVAQPDGILKNVSDFWGALENQLRPATSLVVTLELELGQEIVSPLVFSRIVRVGEPKIEQGEFRHERMVDQLRPGWEAMPVQLGGVVTNRRGGPVPGAALRLMRTGADGRPEQVGVTIHSDVDGRYRFARVPPGDYTLVVELAGQAPIQQPLTVAVRERGEPLPELAHHVEVPME